MLPSGPGREGKREGGKEGRWRERGREGVRNDGGRRNEGEGRRMK